MPDPPPPRRRPVRIVEPTADGAGTNRYAELHCLTNYSFLEGASHPDELVAQAHQLGLSALAITDRNSLAGVVRAHVAARDCGLKLLIGAEIQVVDGNPLVLLAMDRGGYGRLSRLITLGRRRAEKGRCLLYERDIYDHHEGLLGIILPPRCTGQRSRRTPDEQRVNRWRDVLGDRCYLAIELHRGPDDERFAAQLHQLSIRTGVPLVAANDVHLHVRKRQALQDVLTAIRSGCRVDELGQDRFANSERCLKSAGEMRRLLTGFESAVERTLEVAGRCRFSLEELRYEYPEEHGPEGEPLPDYLARLTWEGARIRYPDGIPEKVRRLIEYELQLIGELAYEPYFLTVWDLVRFARSQGILCQGRGSAANSAVCYCLGVTSVDPERIDVLFERFVSKERDEAPDIDVDFEHERREEVIQYLYRKYGRDRAGMTGVVITYRPRSAIRDVAKALGWSADRIDLLAQLVDRGTNPELLAQRMQDAGLDPAEPAARQLLWLVHELLGFPRHLSQHVGGMVMTRGPLSELVPIENAAMGLGPQAAVQQASGEPQLLKAPRTVIQWDKDDLDALGILKVDCLALGMLTAIRKCFDMLTGWYRQTWTLATVPAEDPHVYAMIQSADTMGIFQIESRAQMSMLPRLRPACFYDLVIEVAIVRPGPIQGDMVHPYLKRRSGEEPVTFPDRRIESVLAKTLGVPIFQEQAMRLAVVAAGFTPGEADQLRRAMGAWRKTGVIDQFHRKLIDGMLANGYSSEFAERLFRQIRGFGEYGFPESHAASFALLVYVSAWLKRYYPAAFTAALLNSQPMGFYAPAQLIRDARDHGVQVLPVDVNFSEWDCRLENPGDGASRQEDPAIRIGFRLISGLPQDEMLRVVEEREQGGMFVQIDDLVRRCGVGQGVLTRLARADALRSLGHSRRKAYWQSLEPVEDAPLFRQERDVHEQVDLPRMSGLQEVIADYRTTGHSLRAHPFRFVRHLLTQRQVVAAIDLERLEPDRKVRVAGLVLLRQRPGTASGITFVTLEDETGIANLIIHPDVWERFRTAARTARGLIARGLLQRQDQVIHVLVDHLEDMSDWLTDANLRSRDFQ